MKDYPAIHFSILRIIVGVYLCLHFAFLIPYAPEIWSNQGILSDSSLNFTYNKFPNILQSFDSPWQTTCFVSGMFLLSGLLLVGRARPWVCLALWYGWACLFHGNNLISNPGIPMMGWLLLAFTIVPKGEPLRLGKSSTATTDWQMPAPLFWGAWIILGVSYTISGIDKAMAPSWQDGSAMSHLMANPLARDWWWTHWLASLPNPILKLITWATLALELCFGFFCIFRKTRPFAWGAIVAMHLGILTVIDFADLTWGVLMLHFFTFDPRWFQAKPTHDQSRVVFFDGICGFCNSTVNTLIDLDPEKVLRFSALQGKFAKESLNDDYLNDIDTLVYLKNGKIHHRTNAVIHILRDLGGIGIFLYPLLLIPQALRNPFYNLFARFRYKLFGKLDACRMPTPDQRSRFID